MGRSIFEMTAEENDSTKRLQEAVNRRVVDLRTSGNRRDHVPFIACKMADGSADGTLYESRADAVRHHQHDTYWFYVAIGHDVMSFKEAWLVLQINRAARATGHVFGSEQQLAIPMMPEQISPLIPRTLGVLKGMNQ